MSFLHTDLLHVRAADSHRHAEAAGILEKAGLVGEDVARHVSAHQLPLAPPPADAPAPLGPVPSSSISILSVDSTSSIVSGESRVSEMSGVSLSGVSYDDGEPASTAGKPIFAALEGKDVDRLALAREQLIDYAGEVGLDVEQFTHDLDNRRFKEAVNAAFEMPLAAGVQHERRLFYLLFIYFRHIIRHKISNAVGLDFGS